ncbi:complex I subunit 5 family protein [Caldisericum exile]|uniref:Na(+)/H(+) antiporter subunit D n=1 Tax=Caldisericum exile (strain DSM 21853 / NBRC 104410 / AZM16c01) TaxID=511051 RepID=A0A7U6GDV5_CALEA|nr:proton-conducting transporter membrane subunit [Caldisericum exile]BAL80536.1 Na(+)/H(+) antiporter subunit D [Caldisericum exile AZM16c01]
MVNLANPTLLVVIPLFFAFLSIIVSSFLKKLIKFVPFIVSAINLVVIYFIGVKVLGGSVVIGTTAGLNPPYIINLAVDKLNFIIALMVNVLGLLISFYNIFYVKEEPTDKFHILFTLLIMSSSWISVTGDLFNMFVAFEVLSLSSFGLVGYLRSKDSIEAGFKYVVLGILAGSLILLGVVLVYAQTGTLNMAHIASKLYYIGSLEKLIPYILIFLGLAVEGALFPVNSWLPDAHPAAPSGVSAMLSGIVTTTAIYAIIRVTVTVFNYSAFIPYLFIIALLTLFFGEVAAFFQKDLKRMLAYSTIGQTGLFVLAFSVGTQSSISASIAQMINHSVSKAVLFLVAGIMIEVAASRNIDDLKGFGRSHILTSILFVFAALSLIGIPPFFGFFTKLAILQSLLDFPGFLGYFAFALVLIMAIVEGVYFYKVFKILFAKGEKTFGEENPWLVAAPFILVLILVFLSARPMNIINFTYDTAGQLIQRTTYLTSVLGGLK